MKRKFIVLFTTVAMLFSMISITVQAAGTGDGSSPENAKAVSTFSELTTALGDPAVTFIETAAAITAGGTITVPTGKTLTVQPVPDMEFALNINSRDCKIQSGGTLINNGGIRNIENRFLEVDGILQNNAKMDDLKISVNNSGSIINGAGGLIADNSTVLIYSGSIFNSGTIACVIHKIGTDAECAISGVDSAMIRQTNAPVSYADITYNTIALPASDTATVGLVGDNSQLAYAPDTWLMFAKGYAVNLTEGQTLVIQTSTDFRAYLYLTKALTKGTDESVSTADSGGIRYTAEKTQTYYIFVGGYDTFDNGTLTLTVYDPAEHLNEQLDFTNPSIPSTGDGWSWDAVSNTLTLSGLMLSSASNDSIVLPDGASLVLAAGTDNFIQSDDQNAIVCNGGLSISGSGNLTINASEDGIFCKGKLGIDVSGKFSVSGSNGIYSADDISIKNCSNMIVYGSNIGINSGSATTIADSHLYVYGGNFAVSSGPVVKAETISKGGDITISNSYIDANCHSTGSAAIFAGDNVSELNPGVHARIILNGCGILSEANAYIVNTDFPKGGQQPNCQTITGIAGLTKLTSWDQAAKNVIIDPVYNVIYNANSGTGTLVDSNNSYFRTEKVTVLPNSFSLTGYTFTGWNTTSDGSGTNYSPNSTFVITKDTTLFALWKAAYYTVTFVDWNGTVIKTQTVNNGESAAAPASPTRSGYTFSGWNAPFTNILSNLTVTAQYIAAPTSAVAGAVKNTAAVVKTGEQGGFETLAFMLAASALGVFSIRIALRKRAQK